MNATATTIKKSDRFEIQGTMYRISAIVDITTDTFGKTRNLRLTPVNGDTAHYILMSLSHVRQAVEDGSITHITKQVGEA